MRDTFGLARMIRVGDRAMITSARIKALKELGGLSWITSLRAPQIAKLAADNGPLQMPLFDTRDQAHIDAEAAPDGIYVIRTPLPATDLDSPGVVEVYKALSQVERDFRTIKVDDLDLRPVRHHLTRRVQAHVFIVMLAAHLTWHLRAALAPLTLTDETPPTRANPVAPATVSPAAAAKASRKTDPADNPARSFRGVLAHLASLTRNTITHGGHTFDKITTPTPTQDRAFRLLGAPIPLTLTLDLG